VVIPPSELVVVVPLVVVDKAEVAELWYDDEDEVDDVLEE
jgi:hypothetical protein